MRESRAYLRGSSQEVIAGARRGQEVGQAEQQRQQQPVVELANLEHNDIRFKDFFFRYNQKTCEGLTAI